MGQIEELKKRLENLEKEVFKKSEDSAEKPKEQKKVKEK